MNNLLPFSAGDKYDDQGRKVSTEKSDQEKQQIEKLDEKPAMKTERSQTDTPVSPTVNTDTQKQNVNVMLTNVGQSIDKSTVDASAFITNAVESTGKCTYFFTNKQSSAVVKKEVEVMPNPTTTTCKTTRFSSQELSQGIWVVSVEYNSDTSYGKTQGTMELTVE